MALSETARHQIERAASAWVDGSTAPTGLTPIRRRHRAGVIWMVTVVVCAGSPSPAHQENDVRFSWAVGARLAGASAVQPVTSDVALSNGDTIGVWLERDSGYVYLLHVDASGAVALLVSSTPGLPGSSTDGERWFRVDGQRGPEALHVVASATRLERLESLLTHPLTAAQLERELSDLRRANRRLRAPAERPIVMGGRVRGEGDLQTHARTIEAQGFFHRVIRIDHR
jgi:hypothetical protein